MSHIATSEVRIYRSQLREEQAAATRARILDATVKVMAGGIASVSIPAVAREAGVSVPTIYRHFATKGDLLASLYPYLVQRAGLEPEVVPHSIDDLRDGVRAVFKRIDSFDDIARAAIASPAAREARSINMPDHLALIGRLAESIEPRLSKDDRDRITRLLAVLTASSSLRMWRDNLGASVEDAADDVDWMVRAAIAAATSRDDR
jgi:AcrR family transcriptional regulator